jgi:hypothetical protein
MSEANFSTHSSTTQEGNPNMPGIKTGIITLLKVVAICIVVFILVAIFVIGITG